MVGCLLIIIKSLIACSPTSSVDDLNHIETVPFEILTGSPMIFEDEESTSITTCRLNTSNIEISSDVVELVITNGDDFETYISCVDEFDIDFDESFLLAGMKGHHQCLILHKQDLYLENGTLYYRIELREAACFVPTSASYMVKIPIEYSQYPVEFNVIWGAWDENPKN